MDDPEIVTSIIGKYAKVRVNIQKQEGYDDRNQVRQWYQPEGAAAFA